MTGRHLGRATGCGGLALAVVALFVSSPGGALAQAPPVSLNPLHALRKEALKGFRERPLFSPTRAEPHADTPSVAPPPPVPPPSPGEPPDLHLVGIVGGPTDVAIVRQGAGGKTVMLATGDTLEGWRVTVLGQGIRLEVAGRSVSVNLFAPKSAPPTPAGGPADNGPLVAPGDAPP